jgi:hypothetical protein
VAPRDLSINFAKLGDAYAKSNQATKAREAFITARAIMAKLIEQYPDWAQLRQELASFDMQLAALVVPDNA